MKITKQELVKVIKEEIEKTLNEDVMDYIEDGDTILMPVGNILLKQDGRVIFSAKDRDGKELGDVAAQADKATVKNLQQAGVLAPPKELEGPAKEMMELVDIIKSNYEGGQAGIPPAVGELTKLVKSSDFEGLKNNITNIWNGLLKWHRKNGSRLQHAVTTAFNQINTLTRKQTG